MLQWQFQQAQSLSRTGGALVVELSGDIGGVGIGLEKLESHIGRMVVPARGTSRRFPTVSNCRSVQFRRFGVLRILAQTIRHGQESCPKYFSMGEILDHAQNMEADFCP
jgi:hypothetical protein